MKNFKKQKNLGIIIPAFRAAKFLELHRSEWKEITNILGEENIYFIEDSFEENMKAFATEMNWKYYSKQNGNWGSVINFSKKLDFDQKYLAIVDADDILDCSELKLLLNEMDECDDDVIWANHRTKRFDTNEMVDDQTDFWIHTVYFKPSIFKKIQELPEKVYFMDIYFLLSLENEMKSVKKSNTFPYIYYVNIDGQSVSVDRFNDTKFKSHVVLSNINTWKAKNGFKKSDYLCPLLKKQNIETASKYLYDCFKKSENFDEKRKIIDIYKKEFLNKDKKMSIQKKFNFFQLIKYK